MSNLLHRTFVNSRNLNGALVVLNYYTLHMLTAVTIALRVASDRRAIREPGHGAAVAHRVPRVGQEHQVRPNGQDRHGAFRVLHPRHRDDGDLRGQLQMSGWIH